MKIDERLKRCCGRYFAPSIKCEEGSRCSDCFDKLEGLREIERLREALKPFAKVLKGHWSHQSDDMILSIGFGDDKRLELKLGDFRISRSALQQKDNE